MASIILIPNNLLQGVIGRKQLDLVPVNQVPRLKNRRAHFDPQVFHFLVIWN
jgi:hypothetical protein